MISEEQSSIIVDAFQHTTGRWMPVEANLKDEEGKDLSAAIGAFVVTDPLGSLDEWLVSERFTLAARDRLLAMLVNSCDSGNTPRVISALPSCEVLDRLMKLFFAWHANQEDTWIHIPTFSVDGTKTLLLGAIVAAGALMSSNKAMQKFGLAVHEILGVQIKKEV